VGCSKLAILAVTRGSSNREKLKKINHRKAP